MNSICKNSSNKNNNENTYPEGVWGSADYYLWDNWIADSRKYDGKIHRYSLCAPKFGVNGKQYGPNDRHDLAFVRHAYSINNGKSWIDTGASFSNEMINKIGKMLWSGCCIVKEEDDNTCTFIMALTSSQKDTKSGNYIQKLAVSRSKDGEKWSKIEICCEYQQMYGYDMTNEDGEGYCWRDPYLYKDPNTQIWHLFWGAKQRDINTNKLTAVIGHAICKNDELFNEWDLQPPIKISSDYGQAELPAVFYYKNYYYLFVCNQSAATNSCSYCIFASKELTNNYKMVYSSANNNHKQDNHFVNKKIYALTIFETYDHKNVKAVGFYDQLMSKISKNLVLTTTPIIDIEWNDSVEPAIPIIQYNQVVFSDQNNKKHNYDDKEDEEKENDDSDDNDMSDSDYHDGNNDD